MSRSAAADNLFELATRLDRLVALAKRETAAFDEQALRRRAV